MNKPQVSKAAKHSETVQANPSSNAAAAAPQPWNSQNQLGAFEAAMKLFHARNLQEARALFQRAVEGPERDIAQRAQLHMAMCDRRLRKETISLRTAEDYYNYAIALINQRKLAEAREHLLRALEISPRADHVHYALAAACALSGDAAGAHESLKRAIEIEPRNRIMARQDADFSQVVGQPALESLLYPEKKNW